MLLLKKAILFFVISVCLYAAMALLWHSVLSYVPNPSPPPPDNDPISVLEARIARAKPFIPADGDVGYISEVDYRTARTTEFSLQDVECIGRYYATQYTLSPTSVFYDANRSLVVAHFLKETNNATKIMRVSLHEFFSKRLTRWTGTLSGTMIFLILLSILMSIAMGAGLLCLILPPNAEQRPTMTGFCLHLLLEWGNWCRCLVTLALCSLTFSATTILFSDRNICGHIALEYPLLLLS